MLTAAYALFALAQIALSFGAVRLWSRRHSIGALTLALPIAALVWDNAVVGLGSFIGEGTLLTALTYPRFVGHALLTPIWIVTAYEFARRDGVPWLQGRGARAGAWLLYGAMVAIGSVASLVLLRLEPVRGGGHEHECAAREHPRPSGAPEQKRPRDQHRDDHDDRRGGRPRKATGVGVVDKAAAADGLETEQDE
jgi:hypothetical protein